MPMPVAPPQHVLETHREEERGAKLAESSHAEKSPIIERSDLVNMFGQELCKQEWLMWPSLSLPAMS